jgi:hypothetical protein
LGFVYELFPDLECNAESDAQASIRLKKVRRLYQNASVVRTRQHDKFPGWGGIGLYGTIVVYFIEEKKR